MTSAQLISQENSRQYN